jgi:hypothetical protein
MADACRSKLIWSWVRREAIDMGHRNYIGGNTVLARGGHGWSRDELEYVEPPNVDLKNLKNWKDREKRSPDEFDIALAEYATRCAGQGTNEKLWPELPEILKAHFGEKRSYIRNTIRSHKSYNFARQNHKNKIQKSRN